jgi:spore coat polysaccharide biosynthesis protein SpsF (cytidylyltransferase family)
LINKLKRWSDCASHFGINHFHTIDADDPFFDPDEMKASMKLLKEGGYDMVCPTDLSSNGSASVGYSLTAGLVKKVADSLLLETDTEMMWNYLEKVKGLKSIILPQSSTSSQQVRLTLDYEEDYWLLASVCRIVGNYAPRAEIDALFERNPELYKINWFRNQAWKASQLEKKI